MIYTKHLSPWVSSDMLRTAFGVFGTVCSAVLRADWSGRPFGLVSFADTAMAAAAVAAYHEQFIDVLSGAVPLYVQFAMPRATRQSWFKSFFGAAYRPCPPCVVTYFPYANLFTWYASYAPMG